MYGDELENYVEYTAKFVERVERARQEVWDPGFDFEQTRYKDYYIESMLEMY